MTSKALFQTTILAASLVCAMAFTKSVSAFEGLRVITNSEHAIGQLSKQEVVNLFMGGGSGYDLKPVELSHASHSRAAFNTMIVGLTEARIQSYWAQMRFSGRMKPPKMMQSEADVLAYLQRNEDVIAYISASYPVPEGMQVVYELKASANRL
ncbi:hypothetical protein PN836_020600 [Ningiella sp. W23]|uniref:hypothetical protein n=1 Tax=Ningiella sp. W23 TaxID=3023715 RepID=UPI0037574D53